MKKLIFGLIISTVLAGQAQAFDIKKYITPSDLKTLRYGLATSIGVVQPGDPDGDTAMASDLTIFNGIATMRYQKNNQRLWADVSYQFFSVSASEEEIGQDVSRLRAAVLFQKHLQLNGMKLWAGGGGGLLYENADIRHTIDESGYLKEKFDTRNTFDVVGMVNAQLPLFRFRLGIPVEMGFHTSLELPVSSMAPAFNIGANFMF